MLCKELSRLTQNGRLFMDRQNDYRYQSKLKDKYVYHVIHRPHTHVLAAVLQTSEETETPRAHVALEQL